MQSRLQTSSKDTDKPKKKILLAVDLDYTQFNLKKSEIGNIVWIGGKQFWLDLYKELDLKATQQSCELVLAIVTAKEFYDIVTNEAATALRPYLEKHNPHTYIKGISKEGCDDWCLINLNGQHCYELMHPEIGVTNKEGIPKDVFSNIHILTFGSKADAIKKIAGNYNIHKDLCMLLDDTPEVLQDAKNNNIESVSFQCFNNEHQKLEDEKFVSTNLQRIKHEIHSKFQKLLDKPYKNPGADKQIAPYENKSLTFEAIYHKMDSGILGYLANQLRSLLNTSENYFIVGNPILIKNKAYSNASTNGTLNHIQSHIDTYSINDIANSYPKSGSIKVFLNESSALAYAKLTRKGNVYQDEKCWQSAVFKVNILNVNTTSATQQCKIEFKEQSENSINEESNYHLFFETDISNTQANSARLIVSGLGWEASLSASKAELNHAKKTATQMIPKQEH